MGCAGRIYATLQKDDKTGVVRLKHLSYYDSKHKQSVSVDFLHAHNGVRPHVHYGIEDHSRSTPGKKPTRAQLDLANKIRKEFNLK